MVNLRGCSNSARSGLSVDGPLSVVRYPLFVPVIRRQLFIEGAARLAE